jgi:hypothetical protein
MVQAGEIIEMVQVEEIFCLFFILISFQALSSIQGYSGKFLLHHPVHSDGYFGMDVWVF